MINWTEPVETTENPPRPVRVLFDSEKNFANIVKVGPVVYVLYHQDLFARVGQPDDRITLRNVPPGGGLEWVHNANIELTKERDHWKAKAEALWAEVDRMKPVVKAALDYHTADYGVRYEAYGVFQDAICAYLEEGGS